MAAPVRGAIALATSSCWACSRAVSPGSESGGQSGVGEGERFDGVAVDGLEEVFGELLEGHASDLFGEGGFLLLSEEAVDASEAACEGGDGIGVAEPLAHDEGHGEVLEGDAGLGDGRAAGGLEGLGDPDGVDDDIA